MDLLNINLDADDKIKYQSINFIEEYLRKKDPESEDYAIEWKRRVQLSRCNDKKHIIKKVVGLINQGGGYYVTNTKDFLRLNKLDSKDKVEPYLKNFFRKYILPKDEFENYLHENYSTQPLVIFAGDYMAICLKCPAPSYILFKPKYDDDRKQYNKCYPIYNIQDKSTKYINLNQPEHIKCLEKIYEMRLKLHTDKYIIRKWFDITRWAMNIVDNDDIKRVSKNYEELYPHPLQPTKDFDDWKLIKNIMKRYLGILRDVYGWETGKIEALERAAEKIERTMSILRSNRFVPIGVLLSHLRYGLYKISHTGAYHKGGADELETLNQFLGLLL